MQLKLIKSIMTWKDEMCHKMINKEPKFSHFVTDFNIISNDGKPLY
jgi:hypothetical protein